MGFTAAVAAAPNGPCLPQTSESLETSEPLDWSATGAVVTDPTDSHRVSEPTADEIRLSGTLD
jgi:hypothetical protein